MDKVRRFCILLFSGGFAVLWCVLLLRAMVSLEQSKKVGLLAAVFVLLLAAGIFISQKYFRKILQNERLLQSLSWGVIALMGVGLLYFGFALRVWPGWDFGAVFQGALELAEDGKLAEQSCWYFTTYPNNVGALLLLGGVFRLFRGSCSYLTIGILLNVGLTLLGVIFLFFLLRRLYGIKSAFLGVVLCALFLPFYLYAPIFYTDTFALPFVTGTFLLYARRKQDERFLVPAAFVLALGFKIKGSLGVILLAVVIHLWLEREKWRVCLRRTILWVVPFFLTVGFLTALPKMTSFIDTAEAEKNQFPTEHWLAMGLEGSGGFSFDVYFMTMGEAGIENKKAVDQAFIREKLREYGTAGLLRHLDEKLLFTWGDGLYYAPEKLGRDPMEENWLHRWVLYDGADYGKTYAYCNAFHLLLLGGVLLSLLRNLRTRDRARDAVAMQIAVFGLLLFLLVWETRSRYLLNFVPLFIFLGIDGLKGAAAWIGCARGKTYREKERNYIG